MLIDKYLFDFISYGKKKTIDLEPWITCKKKKNKNNKT